MCSHRNVRSLLDLAARGDRKPWREHELRAFMEKNGIPPIYRFYRGVCEGVRRPFELCGEQAFLVALYWYGLLSISLAASEAVVFTVPFGTALWLTLIAVEGVVMVAFFAPQPTGEFGWIHYELNGGTTPDESGETDLYALVGRFTDRNNHQRRAAKEVRTIILCMQDAPEQVPDIRYQLAHQSWKPATPPADPVLLISGTDPVMHRMTTVGFVWQERKLVQPSAQCA